MIKAIKIEKTPTDGFILTFFRLQSGNALFNEQHRNKPNKDSEKQGFETSRLTQSTVRNI